jgi:hypothetical protein
MESQTIESLLSPEDSLEYDEGRWSLYNNYECNTHRTTTLDEMRTHLIQRRENSHAVLHRLACMMKKHDAYVRYNGKEFEFREDKDGEIVAKSENLEDLFEKNSYVTIAQVMTQLQVLTCLGWNGSIPPEDRFILDVDKDILRNILTELAKGE